MSNPYTREALTLKSAFTTISSIEIPTQSPTYASLNFHQLITQHTSIEFPQGNNLKQKINWASNTFSHLVSSDDYGQQPKNKLKAWIKWKKLISAALVEELHEREGEAELSINPTPPTVEITPEVSVNPAPPTIEIVPEISVNPAPPVIEAVPEISVNPAPPVIEVVPEVSVNPAPPTIEVVPEISVNPASPVIEAVPEISVNPASPVIEAVPEISVNPAPPVIEAVPEISVNPAPPTIEVVPEISANPAPPVIEAVPEISVNPAPPTIETVPEFQEPSCGYSPELEEGMIIIPGSMKTNSHMDSTINSVLNPADILDFKPDELLFNLNALSRPIAQSAMSPFGGLISMDHYSLPSSNQADDLLKEIIPIDL